jgi:hypothetical protein
MAGENEDKVHEGLEHLQAAAREMIQATRSLLDALEDLVEDPAAVKGVVAAFGSVAQAAVSRLRSAESRPPGDDGESHVQHIRVS